MWRRPTTSGSILLVLAICLFAVPVAARLVVILAFHAPWSLWDTVGLCVLAFVSVILASMAEDWPFPVYKRELSAYFQNPGVYVTLAIFLAVSGWFVFAGINWFTNLCRERGMQMQYFLPS